MAYAKDKEPVTIWLRKGGREVVKRRARSAGKSMNVYADQMLVDGKLNVKTGKA